MKLSSLPCHVLLFLWLLLLPASVQGFSVTNNNRNNNVSKASSPSLTRSSCRLAMLMETLPDSSAASLWGTAVELGTFPALGMFVTTAAGLRVATPPPVIGALQHFSAGILLTTVAKELLPEMVKAQGLAENLASGMGFFSGVGVLILLGILLPEEKELLAVERFKNDEEEKEEEGLVSLRNRRLSRKGEAFALGAGEGEKYAQHIASDAKETATATTDLDENALLAGQASASDETDSLTTSPITKTASVPIAFLTAIAIDATLDGLLIGISLATGDHSTAPILSASMAVESTFLGLTIATALKGQPDSIALSAAAFGPGGVLTGSLVGGLLSPTLVDSPVLLALLLGFGTSTILFMVAEELLLQAHEEGGTHIWWVDFQLYTGFFASVMVEKWVGM